MESACPLTLRNEREEKSGIVTRLNGLKEYICVSSQHASKEQFQASFGILLDMTVRVFFFPIVVVTIDNVSEE